MAKLNNGQHSPGEASRTEQADKQSSQNNIEASEHLSPYTAAYHPARGAGTRSAGLVGLPQAPAGASPTGGLSASGPGVTVINGRELGSRAANEQGWFRG